ncbi:MAG: hypothetical protein AAF965_06940 [Pseudomonadota bacterium]
MTNEILTLIVAHFACADLAIERPLTVSEAQYCGAVYQQVKLAFVPGVTSEDFVELSAAERHAVSMSGYRAFYTWRTENPDRVSFLERVARGETTLGRAG